MKNKIMKDVKFGKIDKFVVHFVGNKTNGEGVNFSNNLIHIEKIEPYIKKLLLKIVYNSKLYLSISFLKYHAS